MLNLSVSHIPGTVDACPVNGQMHLRFRVQRGMIRSAKLIYNCDKNFWHQFRNEAEMKITHTDSELEYYSVAVPLTDTRFSYIFELNCSDGKIRFLSEEGLTDSYDHTLGYFSFFQYTSQFACDTMAVPEWVKTATCYQIFPERFAVGNSDKDLSYELIGDYYYPCLTAPEPPCIGIWGMRRLKYLREHKKILYQTLFYTEKLKTHLEEVDQSAEEMFELLVKQLSAIEGVTEDLKATDQMAWVARMNNIHHRASEIVYQELIYQ